jgi:phenylacetate-CoA ligase
MAKTPLDVYAEATARVPAYRRFLEERCGTVPEVRDMEDFGKLPFMDKPSYIQVYPLAERCLDGTLKGKHVLSHSSGSSGQHLYWPNLPELEQGYWQRTFEELERNYRVQSKSTLIVLGLLMGGNLSGALFAYVFRAVGIETGGAITLATPGRDEESCFEVLRDFSPQFDQTVLFSYGATAKNILETAAARGVPVEKLGIKLRLIGEGYSEAFRDRINELLGYPYGTLASVTSGYGATDFRNVGKETPLCLAIRRILHERDLLEPVLGLSQMPTLCQYSPGAVHVEEVEGELVMTRYNAVPLVRYRSGDGGLLRGYEEMMGRLAAEGADPLALMAERGHDPASASRDPFVLVTGRRDGLTFCGTKLLISKVKAVLEDTPYLSERLSGEFQMKRVFDENQDPRLDLALVPRPDAPDLDAEQVAEVFADALSERQGGIYSAVLAKDRATAVPRVRFVRREEIMTPSSFKIRYLG